MENSEFTIRRASAESDSEEMRSLPQYYRPLTPVSSPEMPFKVIGHPLRECNSDFIQERFLNTFNFSKLITNQTFPGLTIGITSANQGEGKTLVACNMAVSLVRAYRKPTVIIDMNFEQPKIHEVFGSELTPGLAEIFQHNTVYLTQSRTEQLYVIPVGDVQKYKPGIQDTLVLRDLINTLKNEFDFIIVDMRSVFPAENFPVHFVNELDGLIAVVNQKTTKRKHLENLYKRIDQRRFFGYVFNKVEKGHQS